MNLRDLSGTKNNSLGRGCPKQAFAKIVACLLALQVSGRVYNFEPQPNTFYELSRIKENFNLSNVDIFNMALVDDRSTKSIEMVVPEINGMSRSGLAHIIKNDDKNTKDQFLADKTFEKLFGEDLSQDSLDKGRHI
jgi:FkbM family methyltransferase